MILRSGAADLAGRSASTATTRSSCARAAPRDGRRLHRADRLRPRRRVGHRPDQHHGQHPAAQGRGLRGRRHGERRLRPRRGVGRVRDDTFDGLGAHPAPSRRTRAPLVASVVAARSTAAVNVRPVVTFTEAVTAGPGAFTLTCTTSGAVPVAAARATRADDLHRSTPRRALAVGDSCTVTVTGVRRDRRRHQRPAGHHDGRPHLHLHRRRPLRGRADRAIPADPGLAATTAAIDRRRARCGASSSATTRARAGAARLLPPGLPVTATPPPPTRSSSSTAANRPRRPRRRRRGHRHRSASSRARPRSPTVRRRRRVWHRRTVAP